MRTLAMLIGALIMALSIFGLVQPQGFAAIAGVMQVPPGLYCAAFIRVLVGPVLFLAAPSSRARMALRILGALIALAGVASLFIGVPFGQVILHSWAEGGGPAVRIGAAGAFAVGAFIFSATVPAPSLAKGRYTE